MKRRIRYLFLVAMLVPTSTISSAQTKPNNPFGLVYRNAITENVAGKVNIHPVTYKLHGLYM
jgi:hypothetical protein